MLELSDSIKQFGIIQPLIVQKKEDHYEIIAGERRWRAAKMAGLKEVPAIIKSYTDREILEISLIENIQRENLNPIDEARAYKKLLTEFHLKQDEVAERVSKSRTAVTNSMRLLKLTSKVLSMVIADMISAGHARALLGISDETLQENTAMKVIQEFVNEYLESDYEAVYAVHNNTSHIHGHIIWNSVRFTDGYKYHYKKGDWERDIQSRVDRICEKYGLNKLEVRKDKEEIKNKTDNWEEK